MKTLSVLLMVIMMNLQSVAQEIAGKVIDEKKEPVINATITVYRNNIKKGGTVSDFDGNYLIKSLDAGQYDLIVSYIGYDSICMKQVVVDPAGRTTVNFTLTPSSDPLPEVAITAYKMKLIDQDNPGKKIITANDINRLATTEVTDIVSMNSRGYRARRGASLGGARSSGTLYIIDGVQVQNISGSAGIPMAQNETQYYNPSTTEYKHAPENDFRSVAANPLSTMSVDVDRASYTNIRRIINEGNKPPADAVRIEEMINYFKYDYPQPTGNNPISINTEVTDCPWRAENKLLKIGIQAKSINTANLPPSNLVFLIDVSGSMDEDDKLPLLISGMKLLVDNIRPIDKVAIVAYAGAAGLVLPPTPGTNKEAILDALDRLESGGSTAGGAGIKLAYKTAVDNYIKGGNNRVILATDGDFNVGISNDNDLEALIVAQRKTGVYLTCLGFGTGNYKDAKMETLADKGNGNYHYIDNIKEARKALVSEFGGTLFTVAKDVKTQIEFNPDVIQGYRLIGYENRLLNEEDFKDDKKDAGDMGAGHTVTIIYELIPTGINSKLMRNTRKLKYRKNKTRKTHYSNELATIKFRYKKPEGNTSKEMAHIITNQTTPWKMATNDTRFATSVAMFGMMLKDSEYRGTTSYNRIIEETVTCMTDDADGSKTEFTKLVNDMKDYNERTGMK